MCHHCCRRIPHDHARTQVHGTTVATAFDDDCQGSQSLSHRVEARVVHRSSIRAWDGMMEEEIPCTLNGEELEDIDHGSTPS